jgi:branched-chain amino acid transport system permease protein
MLEIYLILALSMNLLAGFSGLLSLAQAVFYGISAYVTALLMLKFEASFWIALPLSMTFNVFVSLPLILFSRRLRNLYLALATLSWQIVIYVILYNWTSVTAGPFGLAGIPSPSLFSYSLNTVGSMVLLGGVFSVGCYFLYRGIDKSHFGLLLKGVRDNSIGMTTLGHNPNYYLSSAIVISAMTAAIAGSLFAVYYTYIDPSSFTLDESILIISIVLIGGLGSVEGSLAGAAFYVLLPEALRFLELPSVAAANLRMMIYALALILIVRYRPHGLLGKYQFD